MDDNNETSQVSSVQSTAPKNYQIITRGCSSEDGKRIADAIFLIVGEIGKYINVSRLDGITIAADYGAALRDLDLGYKTEIPLVPTNDRCVGVAMTPVVMRNGVVKSHIVCDLAWIWHLADLESEHWPLAFQLIAHECAHVHDQRIWDESFPGVFLTKTVALTQVPNIWKITNACWSEYAATRMSAAFGKDQTEAYEETFVATLLTARELANEHIKNYRIHGQHQRICDEVCKEYGDLLKFASYLLGHLAGSERNLASTSNAKAALEEHWFAPFYETLRARLEERWNDYGHWRSLSDFDRIGIVVNDVLESGGIFISLRQPGQLQIRVPFSPETLPSW